MALRARLAVLWCQATLRHRGWVVALGGDGTKIEVVWMCDHCGLVKH